MATLPSLIKETMPASVIVNPAREAIKADVAKRPNNSDAFGLAVRDIMNAKDVLDTGAFSLMAKHRDDLASLARRLDIATEEESVRSIVLNAYRATDEGTRHTARYNTLVQMKANISPSQKTEKETLHKRFNSVYMFMTRAVTVYQTIARLEKHGFRVTFKGVPNTKAQTCRVIGPQDDESCAFSTAQIIKLGDVSAERLAGLTSFSQLQELSKSGKAGTPNRNAAGASNTVAASNLATVAEGVDTAIAGLTFEKDGGIPPAARNNLMRLWAHLDLVLTSEQKEAARKAFEEDADKSDAAEDDTAAA